MKENEYEIPFKDENGRVLKMQIRFKKTTYKANKEALDMFIDNIKRAVNSDLCGNFMLTCLLQQYRQYPDIGYSIENIKVVSR